MVGRQVTITPGAFDVPDCAVKLNLGCQSDVRRGWVNVDRDAREGVVVCDLDGPWPFDTLSVDYILASHIIEHVGDFVHFMAEAHRVMKYGAALDIITPHAADRNFWRDPTHLHGYTPATFSVYCREEQASDYHIPGLPTFCACEVRTTFDRINDDEMEIVNARLVK
jgi:SAM-dependent methyltransferase